MTTGVLLVFLIGLIIGLPMVAIMGASCLIPWLVNSSFSVNPLFMIRGMVGGLNSTPILAIPLFMLSGAIMAQGGISKRLFDVFAYIAGKKTAGIPIAVVCTCLFYGAISGSAPATCAAVGAMTVPILLSLGYEADFAGALVATASSLGVVIPPSIPFVIYGIATGASVGSLFIAGIIPGLFIGLTLMIYAYYYCKKHGEDKAKIEANYMALKERGLFGVLKDSFWAVMTPIIILGGIYSGIVTPTEAAVVSVFYALIVSLFFYRTIKIKDIPRLFSEAVKSFAPMCCLIGLATVFGRVLALLKVPGMISGFIDANVSNRYLFLAIIILFLLLVGMLMDVNPAIMILAPMVLPAASSMGISEIHLGVVMICTLAVGFVTPPFGMNLFVISPLVKQPVNTVVKKVAPFILTFIIALCIIACVPQLSMYLVG